MRVKKILKINNLGTFNNFQWPDNCDGFKQYNFFYGWNYSGKTTLSRIFRCLEIKSIHSDFPNAEFSLETDNGNVTEQDISDNYQIRVFNEDFVDDNFLWNNEDAQIEPVLILGKEAKGLESKLRELEEQKEKDGEQLKAKRGEKERIERALENSLTDKASEIRNILGITNPKEFDKNSLQENINGIKDSYEGCILSADEKEKILSIYRSKKAEEVAFKTVQLKLSTFTFEVRNILSQKVTAQQIIEKLKENPKLSSWVKEGIDLHQNEEICQFCGNPLPSDLFERLNKHFSDEFDDLMEQISTKEEKISTHIEEIKNLILPDKARLFESLQSEFERSLKSLNAKKDGYIQTLDLLKIELKKKREKPFDSLEIPSLCDITEELASAFKEIESVINKHNSKVDSFEVEKQQAKGKLLNHFAAEFIKEKKYFDSQGKIKETEGEIQNLSSEIDKVNEKIEKINSQIKAETIGANKINEYLRQFFNDDKLRIETTDDSKYKIYRDDYIAKNLSTGEKNIISLVYFFAKLEETHFNFRNAVIFIDDPVSSLDSNHIFKVYGFISEKLRDCGQLFITTHNFDFFNLLKDLGNKVSGDKVRYYIVKKVRDQTGEFSYIENLPAVLLKYKSEYNYLFSIVKSYRESKDKSNFGLLYLLPNVLRRFFEAYLFMKYPDGREFRKKIETFLKDKNISDKQKVLKLMDEYSHEEDPTHSQKFPDIKEVEDAIKFILETIEEKDKEHCEALKNSLTD